MTWRMELSSFLLRVPGFPDGSRTLLYSTTTGAFAALETSELDELEAAISEGRCADPEFAEIIEDLGAPTVSILVRSRAEEEAGFQERYRARREGTALLSLAVSTSFACNFACTYCFQDAYLDGHVMGAKTADALTAWCATRMRETGARRLHFTVLGGEPLLHPGLVEGLVSAASRAAESAGGRFGFGLITNGYFLTPETLERLLPFGLSVVQITLDGDEASHGQTRPTKKGQNAFRAVWDNLLAIRGRVPIRLAGNYTPGTVDAFPRLLERLRAAGLSAEEITRIAWKPALQSADSPLGGACHGSWSTADGAARLWLADRIADAGFESSSLLEFGPCGIHNENHFAVDPAGRIYECPGFVGHAEWAIGDAVQGIDPVLRARSRPDDPLAACGPCSWRANCAGGCLANRWLAEGRATGLSCEAGYYAEVAPSAVKREFARTVLDPADRDRVLALLAEETRRDRPARLRLAVIR
jgi:uncharacterized protein